MVRDNIRFRRLSLLDVFLKLINRELKNRDYAIWISNGIKWFETYNDIELTVVFPHQGVRRGIHRFSNNNINYVCFHSEDDNFISFIKQHIFKRVRKKFEKNRDVIKKVIEEINPDIVNVIGAENPYYSITALDIPNHIPTIVSLQTLLSEKGFKENYKINDQTYEYRSSLERQIIQKCDYIGAGVPEFVDTIRQAIKPDVIALKMKLAVGVDVDCSFESKEYDFVYFAANINKACDLAIEAFSIAKKKYPHITLNISGYFSPNYKKEMDSLLQKFGIIDGVYFTGAKQTHEEVIAQIKKSRFALLPFKVDQMPSTIREAMACGLPVASFATPSMRLLNDDRESILLAELGDVPALAKNMIKLLEDERTASRIRENAIITIKEKFSNKRMMQDWRCAYVDIKKQNEIGTPISEELLY
jgi:glycosyltransferase involved in cell wall biosynthesis